jgi:integrase/recombinase XerD
VEQLPTFNAEPSSDSKPHAVVAGGNPSTIAAIKPLVAAQTDAELARAYLDSRDYSPHSRRAASKEIARFLLYCRDIVGRSLRELTIEDVSAYKELLRDPPAHWIGVAKVPLRILRIDPATGETVKVDNPDWRPLRGPLSDASRRQAMLAIGSFLGFAAEVGYLDRNPGTLVQPVKVGKAARITRFLPEAAVQRVLTMLAQRPPSRAQARDLFLVRLFWGTGARLDEVCQATMGNWYVEEGLCWLDVTGKGNKARRLPIHADVLSAFRAYRIAYGLPAVMDRADATPLVLSTRHSDARRVTPGAIYLSLKAVFREAAAHAGEEADGDMAHALAAASPHWLRHSMLSHFANQGVPLKILQETAGHASITTTETYLHISDRKRHAALTGDPEPTAS